VVLSKREKFIGIGVLSALSLFALDSLLIEPYWSSRSDLLAQQDKAQQQIDDNNSLFSRQHRLLKVWRDIQQGGLRPDAEQAESLAHHALLDWAQDSGVNIDSLGKPEITPLGKFQVIKLNINATGTMAQISNLLWALETAKIPMRVHELQLSARREGTDDLTIRLMISTLCLPPDNSAAPPAASVAAAGGGS
jgi:type II secretion system (T2SS) protein M